MEKCVAMGDIALQWQRFQLTVQSTTCTSRRKHAVMWAVAAKCTGQLLFKLNTLRQCIKRPLQQQPHWPLSSVDLRPTAATAKRVLAMVILPVRLSWCHDSVPNQVQMRQ